jgi:hypothetical protein
MTTERVPIEVRFSDTISTFADIIMYVLEEKHNYFKASGIMSSIYTCIDCSTDCKIVHWKRSILSLKSLTPEFCFEIFINKTYKHWNDIRLHNLIQISHCLDHLFTDLPLFKIPRFSEIFYHIPHHQTKFKDLSCLFEFLEAMVRMSIRWINKVRSGEKKWESSNFDFVDLLTEKELWKVDLSKN